MAEDILLVLGMATCHELNIIEDLMLDEKMISSMEWSMEGRRCSRSCPHDM